jgi:mannosylglycoprotein endo-beta-mannosidase
MEMKKMLENQLKNIIKEEEIKWIQRAKEKEILEGDNNTRYYHSIANGRRRKTLITNLNQDEGLIEGQENLKRYITDFYKKTLW